MATKVSALYLCQLKCYHEPNCVSINFNVTPDSKGLQECKLNNAISHKRELKKYGSVYKGAEVKNWNVTFRILFEFEFDALVRIYVLVGFGHAWIRVRIGLRMIIFIFVSDCHDQTWIRIRVSYGRVHVRIRVRVEFLLIVGFILVSDYTQYNH